MRRLTIGLWMALLALPAVALAADGGRSPRLAVWAGVFNVNKSVTAGEGGVELRLPLAPYGLWAAAGVAGTEDSSVWGWGGVQRPFDLGRRWRLTPGFAIALYEDGDGKDLGGVVEFRSSIEIARALGGDAQVGLLLYHLSNAGFYDLNPGSNSAVLAVSFSLP